MFHKFSVTTSTTRRTTKTSKQILANRAELLSATTQPSTKRRKISKACVRCRLQRLKCEERKPCTRCVDGGLECLVSDAIQSTPDVSNDIDINMRSENSDLLEIDQTSAMLSPLTIAAITLDFPNHLDVPLKPSDLASDIQRFLATGFTAIAAGSSHSVASLFPQIPHPAVPSAEIPFMPQPLTRDERRKYLCIFWNSCHPQLNIVSEAESLELEATPQAFVLDDYSVQNALLDACLALGIQHSHATGLDKRLSGSRHRFGAETKEYVGWPGFEHFHHCRERMRTNAEVTLQALQCHALMVLYLLRGYAFRDAYNMLGITVRKAYVAELHRPPPSHLSENERTSHMQLWWLIFSLDLQCSAQLNMPAACQKSLVKCPRPAVEALALTMPARARFGDGLPICVYSTLVVDLATIMTDISARVSTADLLDDSSDDLAVLEDLSSRLAPSLQGLENWHSQVPEALRLDAAFGDSDAFDLGDDLVLPIWLQRQRILLALQYHNAYVLILRPFVSLCFAHFTEVSGQFSSTTTDTEHSHVQQHISSAVHHASAIVHIVSTFTSTSDVLYGWPEVLQPIWNATMVLVSYVYGNSLNAGALAASQSLARVEPVLQCFGATTIAAESARAVAASLIQGLKDLQTLSG